jgi:mycothiol synthase
MENLTVRPYTDADAEAVAELMNLVHGTYGADAGFSGDTVRAVLGTMARDPQRDSALWFAPAIPATPGIPAGPDGLLVAVCGVCGPPPGGSRCDTFDGVHPGWQDRDVNRVVFDWALRRVREMHAAQDPATGWHFDVGAFATDARAIATLEDMGLAPVRYFFEMIADPAKAPEVPAPDGLRVVVYTPEFGEPLYEAHQEAFADHWGFEREPSDEFRSFVTEAPDFRADLTLLALDGDAIAGYVTSFDGAAGRHFVGHVGTRRPWRRRGVASALVARAMALAAASGRTVSQLGVDSENPSGAMGVYERLGFTTTSRLVTFQLPLPALTGAPA